jgi:hypothetical protein
MGEPNESIVYANVEFLKDIGDSIKAGDVVEYVNFDCVNGMLWVLEITEDFSEPETPRKYVVWNIM